MTGFFSSASALTVAICLSAPAFSQSVPAAENGLADLVVTATKTKQNMQDVPLAIMAMGDKALQQMHIQNFDDYVSNLANVRSGGRGPGQNEIYIRGLTTDGAAVYLAGANGSFPNVALYLDEQPVTIPGRNLDVYITDMERIEVLPGPQGTLFGDSSQAGTVRLITNKPQLGKFDASLTGTVSFTKHGEMSNSLEGFVNVPVTDRLAVRATFYNDNRGGYIDNVRGIFTPDRDIINANAGAEVLPEGTTFESADNAALVQDNFNDAVYQGARFSAKYEIDSDWSVLVQHMRQKLDADGVFDYDPTVGDLEVNRFFPDYLDDEFSQTSATIEGRLGALDIIYTGSYLDREVEQSVDYTGYNNSGAYIAFYTCRYDGVRTCLTPVKGFQGVQTNKRFTNELRVSSPQEERFRFTAGAYYDWLKIETQDNFLYMATTDLGFVSRPPLPDARSINDDVRETPITFFNDITRKNEQIALFGEATFDIVPDLVAITGGLRYYDLKLDFYGSSNFGTQDPDVLGGNNFDVTFGENGGPRHQRDVIPKITLTVTPNRDLLFYGTYSEGYRPGGFNRAGGTQARASGAFPDFVIPVFYKSDNVNNWELGFKTTLFDNRLRFNGAFYYIEWNNIQVSRFDPANISILTFIDNAANGEIKGFEGDFEFAATPELIISGALSYNDAKLTDTSSNVITLAPVGSQLPLTPKFQANLRARYTRALSNDVDGFIQMGGRYASTSHSSLVAEERRKQDSYAIFDASLGATYQSWQAELYVQNLTDERAELFYNTQDDIPRITTNRPQTIGLRVSYRY
ncbi:TonB-dependent receptor [Pedomonas mirosovicensis]|uniref:TonB-dependent receptor n=1 Tax=Pedomonas mirosovicensis TaxID=2908641 RepID=UPI002168BAE7|nr:TonB-dependent receptor [Pedomonas mirosovicensis]MCH8686530.1 TonB-dependent receptor [Pedomonas mirosovicensis]